MRCSHFFRYNLIWHKMVGFDMCVGGEVCMSMYCTFSLQHTVFAYLYVMQCVPEITICLSIEVIDWTGFIGWTHPLNCLLATCSLFISLNMTLYRHLALFVQHAHDPCATISNLCHSKCVWGVTLESMWLWEKCLVKRETEERNADHPVDQHCCGKC